MIGKRYYDTDDFDENHWAHYGRQKEIEKETIKVYPVGNDNNKPLIFTGEFRWN